MIARTLRVRAIVFLHKCTYDKWAQTKYAKPSASTIAFATYQTLAKNRDLRSEQVERYDSAGFRIGQGVVVVGEIVATIASYGLQLVIGQYACQLPT